MEVKFEKKDLDFMGIYSLCMDNKNPLHDKFEIKNYNDKVLFIQESDHTTLITVIDKNIDECDLIFPTPKVSAILSNVSLDDTIVFDKNKMSFNKSYYEFEDENISISDKTDLMNMIESNKHTQKYNFKNLKNINAVKTYIGNEGLDTIVNTNSTYLSSNELGISAIIKNENNIEDVFNIPAVLIDIISLLKLDDIEIDVYKEYGVIVSKVNSTYVIIPIKDYLIPNLFEEQYAEKYNHKDKIVVDKESLVKAVNRIKVIASTNVYSRIFIYCYTDYIELVSKDSNKAVETVSAKVDKELIDSYFILSSNYLYDISKSLEGKNIIIHALNDPTALAVKITDEIENKFFIHVLYPDLEVN